MGKFFKTAEPTFVEDKMFQAPLALMERVITSHDKKAEKAEDELDVLEELYKSKKHLAADDPEVNLKKDEYKKRIDELSKSIYGDMDSFRKIAPSVRKLSADLETELESGLLGQADVMFKQRQKEYDRVNKLKNVSDDRKSDYKFYLDNKYEDVGRLGYVDENTYNPYIEQELGLLEDFSPQTAIEDLNKTLQGDVDYNAWAYANEGYLKSGHKKTTTLQEDKIRAAAKSYLASSDFYDTNTQKYILKAYNQGLTGEAAENVVNKFVQADENAFIQSAIDQLKYKKEEGAARIGGDGYGQTKRKIIEGLEVEAIIDEDGRTPEQKKNDIESIAKIKTAFEGVGNIGFDTTPEELVDILGNMSAGKRLKVLKDKGYNEEERSNILGYIEDYSNNSYKIFESSNRLVEIDEDMSDDELIQSAREEFAIKDAMINSTNTPYKVIVTIPGKGEFEVQATLLELFKHKSAVSEQEISFFSEDTGDFEKKKVNQTTISAGEIPGADMWNFKRKYMIGDPINANNLKQAKENNETYSMFTQLINSPIDIPGVIKQGENFPQNVQIEVVIPQKNIRTNSSN